MRVKPVLTRGKIGVKLESLNKNVTNLKRIITIMTFFTQEISMTFSVRKLLALSAFAMLSSAAGVAMSQTATVADVIAGNPSLSTLNGLIQKAGLVDALKSAGPFTVFAPNNDAFKAVPAKALEDIANNPARLNEVLTFHVLPAKVMAGQVTNAKVKTVHGANIETSVAGTFVTVESGMVITADLQAGNGVVHIIDSVLDAPKK
jgi:uncharacterized surface protein with fasciclin (FAS1) repeats